MTRKVAFTFASLILASLFGCGGATSADPDTTSAAPVSTGTAPPAVSPDGGAASPPPDDSRDAGPTDANDEDVWSYGPWTPNSIPGLAVWLDAAHVTTAGSAVRGWPDQSFFHNDAMQTKAANQPKLVTAVGGGDSPSSINGHPVVSFSRASHTFVSIPDSISLRWSVGGFTIAAVAANRGPVKGLGHLGGTSLLFYKAAAPGTQLNIGFNLNFPAGEKVDDGTMAHFGLGEGYPSIKSTTDGYNDGKPRLYIGIADTTGGKQTLEIRVNGTSVGKTTPSTPDDVTLIGQTTYIGSLDGGYLGFEGDIAELIAVQGALGGSDLASLETFMMAKYGL